MEFVNGPNLKDLIRRQGPFSVEGAAFILRQVAEALDARTGTDWYIATSSRRTSWSMRMASKGR